MTTNIKSYTYCTDTIRLKAKLEEGFVELGARLYEIRKGELYSPSWTSFAEYLKEMKMAESTASKLVSIHERLVLEYKIKPEEIAEVGGYTEAYEILPHISNKKEAKELLEKAKILSRDDLRKELKEMKTGVQMKECKHTHTYTIEICKDCGDRHEVYEK